MIDNIVYLLLGIVIGLTLAPALGEALRTVIEMKRKAMLHKALDELEAQMAKAGVVPTKPAGLPNYPEGYHLHRLSDYGKFN